MLGSSYAIYPTTEVAARKPSAECWPSPTAHVCKASLFFLVREGGRLTNGPQTAILIVGRQLPLSCRKEKSTYFSP